MADGWVSCCQKCTCSSIIRMTPHTIFKIKNCWFVDQLYINQRCENFLDFDFKKLSVNISPVEHSHFWQNIE